MLSVIYAECHIQALHAECHYVDVLMLSVIMMISLCWVALCWCSYAECHYAVCRDAECLYPHTLAYKCENIYQIGPRHSTTLSIMQSIVILSVNYAYYQFCLVSIMLSVTYKLYMLSVIMLLVVMLSVFMPTFLVPHTSAYKCENIYIKLSLGCGCKETTICNSIFFPSLVLGPML